MNQSDFNGRNKLYFLNIKNAFIERGMEIIPP